MIFHPTLLKGLCALAQSFGHRWTCLNHCERIRSRYWNKSDCQKWQHSPEIKDPKSLLKMKDALGGERKIRISTMEKDVQRGRKTQIHAARFPSPWFGPCRTRGYCDDHGSCPLSARFPKTLKYPRVQLEKNDYLLMNYLKSIKTKTICIRQLRRGY